MPHGLIETLNILIAALNFESCGQLFVFRKIWYHLNCRAPLGGICPKNCCFSAGGIELKTLYYDIIRWFRTEFTH